MQGGQTAPWSARPGRRQWQPCARAVGTGTQLDCGRRHSTGRHRAQLSAHAPKRHSGAAVNIGFPVHRANAIRTPFLGLSAPLP